MKISKRNLLPLVFLPLFVASCNNAPQPIDFGHDACTLCEKPISTPEFAALAVSTDGIQFNYDSIECLVQHMDQENVEMEVIKVTDFQHPRFMLNAQHSHFRIQGNPDNSKDPKLAALRHIRSNSLGWKELQAQLLEEAGYISQNAEAVEYRTENFQ